MADAGVEVGSGGPDGGGWTLTTSALDAWLGWQAELALVAPRLDGGTAREVARRRAWREVRSLADAGLTFDEVDRIEAVVAVVATEWNVERLATGGPGARQGNALDDLSEAQRARAEAALKGPLERSTSGAALEARFGAEAMRVLESRRARVSSAWDALVDSRDGR